jgi:hypothetical protein
MRRLYTSASLRRFTPGGGATCWPAPARRAVSQVTLQASRTIPKTPDGANPYAVLDVDIGAATTTEDVTKQFKRLAKLNHPDAEGGSNEKMAELNAAHRIVKEHHKAVMDKLADAKAAEHLRQTARRSRGGQATPGRKHPGQVKQEEMAQSGGLHNASSATQSVRDVNSQKWRSPKEVERAWDPYRAETLENTDRMVNRFEVAIAQCVFFRKTNVLTEVTVRERSLRKTYIKKVWEEIHEMRAELLRRGARNLQQAQLAEDMVAHATLVQKKLNEDFQRQAQQMFVAQAVIFVQRTIGLIVLVAAAAGLAYGFVHRVWYGSFTVMFKKAMLAVE